MTKLFVPPGGTEAVSDDKKQGEKIDVKDPKVIDCIDPITVPVDYWVNFIPLVCRALKWS